MSSREYNYQTLARIKSQDPTVKVESDPMAGFPGGVRVTNSKGEFIAWFASVRKPTGQD